MAARVQVGNAAHIRTSPKQESALNAGVLLMTPRQNSTCYAPAVHDSQTTGTALISAQWGLCD
jgi:hypothetical protein